MRSGVRAGVELVPMLLNGQVIAMHVPVDPEDTGTGAAPVWLREGIARRRILLETGKCPCGAELQLDEAATVMILRTRGQAEATVAVPTRHEPGCEAARPELQKLLNDFASALLAERMKKEEEARK